MQSFGMGVIKYILFAFNFIFAGFVVTIIIGYMCSFIVSGLGILIAGILVLVDVNEYNYFLEGKIQAPPIILIVTGALIFIIAFLGCYGAIRESPTLLIAFAILLGVVFIVELAVGIAASLFKADLDELLQRSLKKTIERSSPDDLAAWDKIQMNLSCCGINNPADWADFGRARSIRPSCCVESYIDKVTNDCSHSPALNNDKYYQEGCLSKLKMRVGSRASILITVGLSVAFIQLLGIILACWLASSIRREAAH